MADSFFARSLAAVVGIDGYRDDIPPLENAVRDAEKLAERLKNRHGYRIRSLTENVTVARFLSFLDRLRADVGGGDRVLFYFAGHGIAPDVQLRRPGCFVFQNARRIDGTEGLLSMDEVKERLDRLPCRHLLVILDCCYAGNFRLARTTRHGEILPAVLFSDHYLRYVEHPARQVLTASAHDQKAHDSLGKRGGGDHSPFAAALLDALEGYADISPPGGDGVITAAELSQYMRDRVEPATMAAGQRQTPELWNLEGHDKGQYVFEVPERKAALKSAPALTEERNPYLPSEPLGASRAELFFGRRDLVRSILGRLAEARLTVLAGPPAVGASSLLRAGVLPALEAKRRVVGPLRPGKNPRAALEAALEAAGVRDPAAAAVWLSADPQRHLVLAIDQWEELLRAPADERAGFEQLVSAWEVAGLERLRWLITVHSGALGARELPGPSIWGKDWLSSRVEVPAMDPDELRLVAVGPARQRALFVEEALAASLVEEVYKTPGALPLLVLVMHRLFGRYLDSGRDDRRLDLADAAGGLAGCLEEVAGELVAGLDDDGREVLDRVLLRLADRRGGVLTGRGAEAADFDSGDEAVNRQVGAVLELLVARSLVVRDAGRVEASHHQVIRAWQDRWPPEMLADVVLQRDLAAATAAWEQRERGTWWSDRRLRRLRQDRSPKPWLSRRERAFLVASLRARRQAQGALGLLVVLLIAAVIIGYDAVGRQREANRRLRYDALTQRLAEQVPRQLTGDDRNPEQALLLAVQAEKTRGQANPGHAARVDEALRRALSSVAPEEVRSVIDVAADRLAFHPQNPGLLAVATSKLRIVADPKQVEVAVAIEVWDIGTRSKRSFDRSHCVRLMADQLVLGTTVGGDRVQELGWQGDRLWVVEADGEMWSLDPAWETEPGCESEFIGGEICDFALSSDGVWEAEVATSNIGYILLSAGPRGRFQDAQGLDGRSTTSSACSGGVAFQPDGAHDTHGPRLVGGVGPELKRWTPTEAGGAEWPVEILARFDQTLSAVDVSPDGDWLAAGGDQGLVWVWRASDPLDDAKSFEIAEASVESIDFGLGRLAVAGSDGRVRVWNLSRLDEPPVVLTYLAPGYSAPDFDAGGGILALVAGDSGVHLVRHGAEALVASACRQVSGNLSWQAWNGYLGTGEPYERTCENLPAHPSVLAAGDLSAENGDEPAATAVYRRLLEVQPELGLNPEQRLNVWRSRRRLLDNIVPDLTRLELALKSLGPLRDRISEEGIEPVPFEPLVRLCLWPTLLGNPEQALPACDLAIGMRPGQVMAHNCRGLTRARVGDLKGAREDFQISIDGDDDAEWRRQRLAWIAALEAGTNPIDGAVIQGLKTEYLGIE